MVVSTFLATNRFVLRLSMTFIVVIAFELSMVRILLISCQTRALIPAVIQAAVIVLSSVPIALSLKSLKSTRMTKRKLAIDCVIDSLVILLVSAVLAAVNAPIGFAFYLMLVWHSIELPTDHVVCEIIKDQNLATACWFLIVLACICAIHALLHLRSAFKSHSWPERRSFPNPSISR